jgi:hypothetical protein
LQPQLQILTQAKKLYQDQILFDENIRRIEEETLKLTEEIESQKDKIDQEIRQEKLLKQDVKNFLGGIIDEIEQEEQQRNESQEIVNKKIMAMEVASTLTSEIFDRELKKIEKEQIAEEIISNIGDEVVEEGFVSSQLDLVEKRIDKIESQIVKSQRISDTRFDSVSSKNDSAIADQKVNQARGVNPDPDQRSSFDGSQLDPIPRVLKIIKEFEDLENKNDNSLRRAGCCPINIPRLRSFKELREMFSERKTSRQ